IGPVETEHNLQLSCVFAQSTPVLSLVSGGSSPSSSCSLRIQTQCRTESLIFQAFSPQNLK
ncbi:hypothetical protein M9458_006107, partial [Cirrhinus mrigala]